MKSLVVFNFHVYDYDMGPGDAKGLGALKGMRYKKTNEYRQTRMT